MSSTLVIEKASSLAVEPETLTYWPNLSVEEQAFSVCYVENGYSIPAVSEALQWPPVKCKKMLLSAKVKGAIKEVQDAIGEIDFLNEKWVKAQLLRLMPMVMGDESVPMVTATGDQIEARVFKPETAMKIIEYVAPKKAVGITFNQMNVGKTDNRLVELAERLVQLSNKGLGSGGGDRDDEIVIDSNGDA